MRSPCSNVLGWNDWPSAVLISVLCTKFDWSMESFLKRLLSFFRLQFYYGFLIFHCQKSALIILPSYTTIPLFSPFSEQGHNEIWSRVVLTETKVEQREWNNKEMIIDTAVNNPVHHFADDWEEGMVICQIRFITLFCGPAGQFSFAAKSLVL